MLTVDEGAWWDSAGAPGVGVLRLRPDGPPQPAPDPGRAVLTGWRIIGDTDPAEVRVTVQVRADLGGRASGACW